MCNTWIMSDGRNRTYFTTKFIPQGNIIYCKMFWQYYITLRVNLLHVLSIIKYKKQYFSENSVCLSCVQDHCTSHINTRNAHNLGTVSIKTQTTFILLCLVQQIGSISLIFSYNDRSVIDIGLTLTAGKFRSHKDLDYLYQFTFW